MVCHLETAGVLNIMIYSRMLFQNASIAGVSFLHFKLYKNSYWYTPAISKHNTIILIQKIFGWKYKLPINQCNVDVHVYVSVQISSSKTTASIQAKDILVAIESSLIVVS